jgi:hypothetical protein
MIPSFVTRFHWHDWDFMWAVEGCLDLRKGFHTVDDFIRVRPMEGSGILSVNEAVNCVKNNINAQYYPLEWAAQIDMMAKKVLKFTAQEHAKSEGKISDSYDELIYDLDAWANMGKYYASKIRGAYYLHAFRRRFGQRKQSFGNSRIRASLNNWKAYTAAATRNYKPQFMAKTRTIDWDALTKDVELELKSVKESL